MRGPVVGILAKPRQNLSRKQIGSVLTVLMNRRGSFERLAMPVLAVTAGCFLDSRPIATQEPDASGPVLGSAGAGGSLPEAAVAGSGGRVAAMASAGAAASLDAGAPIVSQPAQPSQPSASNGIPDAGTTPPPTSNQNADAGSIPPAAVKQCDAVGSYALRATIEVSWEATTWSDVGQGSVELLALAEVAAVDPQTNAATGSFRVCGLALPALSSSALCSSYELQVPESTWAERSLPDQKLVGTYECDADQCALRFAPASYSLGIRLADANGPWPKLEDTSPSQFADDDVDGLPGVSVDVVSVASLPSGPMGCGASNGPGPTGQGNPTTAVMPTELGNLLVGLRTQLTAAMKLTPDCQLTDLTASDAALELRSAGCFVMDGTDPASANASCSEELRASFDETLPEYEALEKGDATKHGGPGKKLASDGPILKAVRFAQGTRVDCEQVRSAKF